MRTIGVVTTSRADYGIYRPILRRITASDALRLQLLVGGMHLRPEFGSTIRLIETDGYPIAETVDLLSDRDDPVAIAEAMGRGVAMFAGSLQRLCPDILVVLGDRFEMHAAALAALPLRIPVAHIHGGELTLGAIDDALRHCMTKLSHLHFVSTGAYRRRVIQLGEDPQRVIVCGAPSLDNLRDVKLLDRAAIKEQFGIDLPPTFVLVACHPQTLRHEATEADLRELLDALDQSQLPGIFVLSNADTGGRRINALIREYVASHSRARLAEGLGTAFYFSAMAMAAALVGNSSSGIIEAASFRLPVVNIGDRQAGRLKPRNVIDCPVQRDAIAAAVARATSDDFRASLRDLVNPYGDGHAAERIVETLRSVDVASLIPKPFHDMPEPTP